MSQLKTKPSTKRRPIITHERHTQHYSIWIEWKSSPNEFRVFLTQEDFPPQEFVCLSGKHCMEVFNHPALYFEVSAFNRKSHGG